MSLEGPLGGVGLAIRFLTIVPLPNRETELPGALGRAAWWFPVVGAALGAVLAVTSALLDLACSPLLVAVLVVALWKLLTGGIHLDGLADCLDGLAGVDPGRRRAIMRDSRVGVFGALGLIACVVIGVAAVADSPARARWRLLLLAPVLGRMAPPLLGAWFRPATPGVGLGAAFAQSVSRWAGPLHVLGVGTLAVVLFAPSGIVLVAGAIAAALVWTAFMSTRLGGITGDVLGGSVELGELAALVSGAMLAHLEVI